ncbi:MAG: alpha-amylase [Clostridia bacterium]|nr:alpha-amylase [Clostridia bacterium]
MSKKCVGIFLALVIAVSASMTACNSNPPGIAVVPEGYQQQSAASSESAQTSSTAASAASDAVSSSATSSSAASSAAESTSSAASSDSGDYSYQLNDDGTIAMNYGAILHAFCWSFATIKENLPAIKEAGYTSVQTSPINECKVGDGGGRSLYSESNGKWWYHYQPTDYVIGNYQLGTEKVFKDMCEEANKLGIKIIVDVPLNHTTSDESVVSENIFNLCENPFHGRGEIASYSSRKQVTQNDLLGLKDLNTQDKAVQEYLLTYLKSCVADGASGFRFDAAKHIELPDDDEEYASDFWPTVLDNGAEFQYGEILQGETDRFADYAKIMNVTASNYGNTMKSAAGGTLSVSAVEPYMANQVDPSRLVTWVESHDNYCNESESSWENLTEADVEIGWAIIAARSGGTPLFFSRPYGSDSDNPWGENTIGKAGSDEYKSPMISALNHFRNDMAGLGEKLSNPDEEKKVLMIERGDKGAVIINGGKEDYKLDGAESVLADGTYKDKVTEAEFTVSGGKISGTVPRGSIVVVY